jgi:hypothetical protein
MHYFGKIINFAKFIGYLDIFFAVVVKKYIRFDLFLVTPDI